MAGIWCHLHKVLEWGLRFQLATSITHICIPISPNASSLTPYVVAWWIRHTCGDKERAGPGSGSGGGLEGQCRCAWRCWWISKAFLTLVLTTIMVSSGDTIRLSAGKKFQQSFLLQKCEHNSAQIPFYNFFFVRLFAQIFFIFLIRWWWWTYSGRSGGNNKFYIIFFWFFFSVLYVHAKAAMPSSLLTFFWFYFLFIFFPWSSSSTTLGQAHVFLLLSSPHFSLA